MLKIVWKFEALPYQKSGASWGRGKRKPKKAYLCNEGRDKIFIPLSPFFLPRLPLKSPLPFSLRNALYSG